MDNGYSHSRIRWFYVLLPLVGRVMGEVLFLPPPETLTIEQRQHWQDQAAYWLIRQEDAERALDYAARQRENCLRVLGMLQLELGLDG